MSGHSPPPKTVGQPTREPGSPDCPSPKSMRYFPGADEWPRFAWKATVRGAAPDCGEAEKPLFGAGFTPPHPQRRADAAPGWGPTMPTWVRPSSAWNAATALAVIGPK